MILDTSAIAAVVFDEPGAAELIEKMAGAPHLGVGAPTLAEAGIVLSARLRTSGHPILSRLLQEFGVTVIPFGEDHWREAIEAYERFGKGRHRAALNFGDCLSYATARLSDQPLLCVGRDFAATGLPLA